MVYGSLCSTVKLVLMLMLQNCLGDSEQNLQRFSLSLPYVLIFRKEDPLFLLFLCLQGKEVAGRF
jgi:hypothetical protein